MIPGMYNDIRLSQSMLDEADQDTSLEVCIANVLILYWLDGFWCVLFLKIRCYGYKKSPTKQNSTLQTLLRVNMLQVRIKLAIKFFNLRWFTISFVS